MVHSSRTKRGFNAAAWTPLTSSLQKILRQCSWQARRHIRQRQTATHPPISHTVNKQKHQEFFVFRTLHPKTQKQKRAKEEEETHFIHSLTFRNAAWGRARPPICLTKASTNFKQSSWAFATLLLRIHMMHSRILKTPISSSNRIATVKDVCSSEDPTNSLQMSERSLTNRERLSESYEPPPPPLLLLTDSSAASLSAAKQSSSFFTIFSPNPLLALLLLHGGFRYPNRAYCKRDPHWIHTLRVQNF